MADPSRCPSRLRLRARMEIVTQMKDVGHGIPIWHERSCSAIPHPESGDTRAPKSFHHSVSMPPQVSPNAEQAMQPSPRTTSGSSRGGKRSVSCSPSSRAASSSAVGSRPSRRVTPLRRNRSEDSRRRTLSSLSTCSQRWCAKAPGDGGCFLLASTGRFEARRPALPPHGDPPRSTATARGRPAPRPFRPAPERDVFSSRSWW